MSSITLFLKTLLSLERELECLRQSIRDRAELDPSSFFEHTKEPGLTKSTFERFLK